MSNPDDNILSGFTSESKILVDELLEKLEEIEGVNDPSGKQRAIHLADCGNQVDRIMGGAQSLAMAIPENKTLILIGDVAQLCKAVSYRASKVKNNSSLVETAIALLLDVTEILQEAVEDLMKPEAEVNAKKKFSPALLERLQWFSSQFAQGISGTVETNTVAEEANKAQKEIDELLKKLGL